MSSLVRTHLNIFLYISLRRSINALSNCNSILFQYLDGKQLAASRDVKFIETSSGIQHNVDELLVGILKQVGSKSFCRLFFRSFMFTIKKYTFKQIRLKETREKKLSASKMKNSRTHASFHVAKEILQKICFNQLDITKSKSCENLHVL